MMRKAIFVPLNTNHVAIFEEVFKFLECSYKVLCHDRIASDEKYHTEKKLKSKNIPYFHFYRTIQRFEKGNMLVETIQFFKMKSLIKEVLKKESPDVVVLAIDNDPISYLFLKLCRKNKIKTVIIQEGSARPEAKLIIKGARAYIIELLRLFGIRLSYILHGTSMLYDKYLVAGEASKNVLQKRGIPGEKIVVTGQPKYDQFMKQAIEYREEGKGSPAILFAAGFSIIANKDNIDFLKELVFSTKKLGLKLIIKLHPRSSEGPEEIKSVLDDVNISHCEIIKVGDETIDLLKKVYGVITVASTVITEALIMDREGVLVNYLAKKQKLPYGDWDAVYTIEKKEETYSAIEKSIKNKKSFNNKKDLLEHNLFSLDGKSAKRVSSVIEKV